MNILNPRLFNPLHWHLKPLLRDPKIRYIYIEGGSSASKTAEVCNTLLIDQQENIYSSIVFRRFHVNIRDSVYNSFVLANKRLNLDQHKIWFFQQDMIKSTQNSAKIRFMGLDNEENIKGIEDYDVVYNNEWSQMLERHWTQQRKRLRGRPNQKFICDWNPISSQLWIYTDWLDLDEWEDLPLVIPDAPTQYTQLNPFYAFKKINKARDSVWIKITHRDNFWVVGHPSGEGGFIDAGILKDFMFDKKYKPNMYRVYANGERGIMRTGGEFWKQFDETKHMKPVAYDPALQTIHISLDENVNPYVSCSIWQVNMEKKEILQIHEIVARSPANNAPKAAKLLCTYLRQINYENVVYVYGDPSGSKRSTIDENSASFYDKYLQVLRDEGFLVVNRVAKSAPEVALSASFINDIYEFNLDGWSIIIGDTNKTSIEDYAIVKENKDGTMAKPKDKDKDTQVTFEPHGHFSDTKRYFIITLLKTEFNIYKSKGKKYFGISG